MITDVQVSDFFENEVMNPYDASEAALTESAMLDVTELAKELSPELEAFVWDSFTVGSCESGEDMYWLRHHTWSELEFAWRKFARLERVYTAEIVEDIIPVRLKKCA